MRVYRSLLDLLENTTRYRARASDLPAPDGVGLRLKVTPKNKRRRVAYRFKHSSIRKIQERRLARTTEHYRHKGWVDLGLYDLLCKNFNINNIKVLNGLPVRFWGLDIIASMISVSQQTARKMLYGVFGGLADDICFKIGRMRSIAVPTRLLVGFMMACSTFTDKRYLFFTFKKYKLLQKKPKRVRAVYVSEDVHKMPLSETQYVLEWWSGLTNHQKNVILNRATLSSQKRLKENYKSFKDRAKTRKPKPY